jgi:hypothetical protein
MRAVGNANAYAHSDTNGYCDSDSKPAAVAYTDVDTEDYANTKASSDSAAAPIAEKVTGLPAVAFAKAGDQL